MKVYFDATGLRDDASKIQVVPLYLEDIATLWWRRRCEDTKKGTCFINTWEEFKADLKWQFYPDNAEDEARGKLRHLTQKGSIYDYAKEFSELLLKIPDMVRRTLYSHSWMASLGGPRWNYKGEGVQTLAQAMQVAESLMEFKRIGD